MRESRDALDMIFRCAFVLVFSLLWAPLAHANGALPGSLSILTPAALPHDVVLATNFGVVLSHDDGQRWVWSCEQPGNAFGILYQMGPAPLNRIFTISSDHLGAPQLAFSDDTSCTWRVGVPASPAPVVDAFADPTNANRVLAVAVAPSDGGAIYRLLESSDGGATLPTLRYTAAGGDFITGVETARSAPNTIVLTMGSGIPSTPALVRSTDGGEHWDTYPLALGSNVSVRLFAIDPDDPARVFLRVSGGEVDRVAVAMVDAANAVHVTNTLSLVNGVITAFVRLDNGHIFVGGTIGVTPSAFLSVDGGASFQPLPTPPTLKGGSARGGTLYAVTDHMVEGFAIATSVDEGQSWQPFMRYDQIQAIASCVKAYCQEDCSVRAVLEQWPEEFCAAEDPTAGTDGGVDVDGATGGTGGGLGGVGGGDGGTVATGGGGCGCDVPVTPGSLLALTLLAALAVAARRGRRA